MLLDGEIPPGARIPERDLCEKLQISRTPLREALKVLAAEGLVQLLPNRGSRAARLTDKDMRDLFEVCQGLEALAGELACERITDAEIADVAAAHAAMPRHYGDRDLLQYYRCNRTIHEAIIAAAGNPVLSGLYESVTARIRRARDIGACNTALIKPNQAGTVTETLAAAEAAREAGWSAIVSARSGESEDVSIVHLAVGWGVKQLKVGSFTRSERMAKWNEGLRIGEAIGMDLPPRSAFPWGR